MAVENLHGECGYASSHDCVFIMHLEMEDKLEDQRKDGPTFVPFSFVTQRNGLVFGDV